MTERSPVESGSASPILAAGRNCQPPALASRVAVLVDADAYFRAFVDTVLAAREQVMVIGWDIEASARLRPDGMPGGLPEDLRGFLNAVVSHRRTLRVYLLEWSFSLLFSVERELLPVVQLGWRTHRRIRFRLDANHPLGACHHQKIVVVDDSVAFVGGLDLTTGRWDTPGHAADDPRRIGPDGRPYAPFHDVQVAVEGRVAAGLGAVARERWRRATGRRLRAPRRRADAWPRDLRPDIENVDVAIARTDPAADGRPAVREVETLYLDSIAAARRSIYIENQYVTSTAVRDALAARLREDAGPEVVMVLPRMCSGWLEESTMGALRGALLATLGEADRHGRLRVLYPRLRAADDVLLNVHAKVMVIDDALIRIGSSNLSNRSMGLDTECDLAIEARGRADVAGAVAALRARLLAEHLGTTPGEVEQAVGAIGSLGGTIDRLRRETHRTLAPLEDAASTARLDPALIASSVMDLERPIEQAPILTAMVPAEVREPLVRSALRTAAAGACLLGGALLWGRAGLDGWTSLTDLGRVVPLRESVAAAVVVFAAFMLGSALLLPVGGLLLATALVLGPVRGGVYALAASVGTAAVFYLIGRTMWGRLLGRLTGRHVDRVGRRIAGQRLSSIALIQMLPVAPFSIVNVLAGGLRVDMARFLVGTLLGITPAIIVVVLLARAVWPRW
jgi:phospholipase D1/2